MSRLSSVVILTAVLVGSAACGGLHEPKVICGPEQARPVPFETVLQSAGASADQAERLLVIRNEADFGKAWTELFEPNAAPPVPTVDFQSQMVIVYAMGTQPNGCYSTEVEEVHGAGPELLVNVLEFEPGSGCVCTQSLVMPFEVIRLSKHAGPVSLCVRRVARSCT